MRGLRILPQSAAALLLKGEDVSPSVSRDVRLECGDRSSFQPEALRMRKH